MDDQLAITCLMTHEKEVPSISKSCCYSCDEEDEDYTFDDLKEAFSKLYDDYALLLKKTSVCKRS